jgi:hypothetical protein
VRGFLEEVNAEIATGKTSEKSFCVAINRLAGRAIKVSDDKIDALVYELYGLTPEEIKIIETS